MTSRAPNAPARGSAWIDGPVPDLLIGAGGAYLLSLPLIWIFARGASAADWPYSIVWIIAILINGPHYGATLLRVYEQREEFRRYALFAGWLTLLLAALFVAGVYEPFVGSLLVTLYFTWSPWHFAGQNYGVSLMFLRRAGVEITPLAKRLLHASFFLSFLLTFLALHVAGSASLQAPSRTGNYDAVDLIRLGIPLRLATPLMLACGAAYLLCLAGALIQLRRTASARALLPVAALVLCQALWFAVPSLLDFTGAWSLRSLAFAAIWISAAHSLQYLWVTFHFAQQSGVAMRLPMYLVRTTLAGNAAFVIPGVIFAPALLGGRLSWDGGLSILVFALVNLHHFMLDGAVWKLRDGRVARALLRDAESPKVSRPARAGRARWPSGAFWVVAGLCLTLEAAELTRHWAMRGRAHRFAETLLDGIGAAGRGHALIRLRLARSLLEEGHFSAARAQFELSASLKPSVAASGGIGRAWEGEGELIAAAAAYEAGVALAPTDTDLLRSAARVRLQLGQPRQALRLLERAQALQPGHEPTRRMLARARRASGQ